MSFQVSPDAVQAAAQNLAGIHSNLTEASASVVAPTTGVVAAAQDQVSAGVAAMFSSYGEEYQVLSAQTQSLHAQFVNLMNAGAGAYLSTEVAAAQTLASAAGSSAQGFLGSASGGGAAAAVAAVDAGARATQSAVVPILGPILGGFASGGVPPAVSALGGVGGAARWGSLLAGVGGATPSGSLGGGPLFSGLNGVVAALQGGGSVVPFGPLGTGLQVLSADFGALPGAFRGFGPLHPGAGTGGPASSAVGPYQALLQNSAINLHTLGDVLRANPVPFLNQTLLNTETYLNAISAQFQYVAQNFPALLAGAPGSIQAGLQGLLAFTPGTYLQQFITNQHTYANIWGTSLNNAAPYFFDGLHLLPSAFEAGAEQLLQGSVSGWVNAVGTGFAHVFITGFATSTTGSLTLATNGTLVTAITPVGTIGELLPILSVPGMRAEYLTSLLPPNTILRQIAQNATNVINTATDASLVSILVSTGTLFPLAPFKTIQLSAVSGLAATLGIELVGGPYNALAAFGAVGDAFVGYTHAGNWPAAIGTLLAAPGVCTDAFLNGQSILPVDIVVIADVAGIPIPTPVTLNLPMDGLLVPETPYTATLDLSAATGGLLAKQTVPVEGAPLSGLLTGLLSYAPQQLADAITF